MMSDLPYLVVMLLLLALLLRMDAVFYIAYVLGGVYLISHVLTRHVLGRLRVDRRFTDHAYLNDLVTVTITLRNRTRWPLPWVHVSESVPIELHSPNFVRGAYSLRGGEEVTLTYKLSCRRRGYYHLGPLYVSAGDPFGFTEVTRREQDAARLVVYPYMVPLTALGLPAVLPFGVVRSHRRLFEDPNRVAGTRAYQTGDSIRQVHWKATAHSDQLLVKRLEPAITQEMAIALDLDATAYTKRYRHLASEWAIVVAASVAHYLALHHQPVALVTNGHDPQAADGRAPVLAPPRPGRGQVMHILEVLARVQVAREGPRLEDFLLDTVLPLSWGVTVALLTPRADVAIYRLLHILRRRGFNPLLMITEPTADMASIMRQARAAQAHAYHVWNEQALHLLEE